MTRAHVPVSGFPVGAAVLTASGKVYPGCNTESIIAGLGVCAERSAVDHAVIHGETDFRAVLVTSRRTRPIWPCGACRQYLYEFVQGHGRDLQVIVVGADGQLDQAPLSRLLPNGFGPADLQAD